MDAELRTISRQSTTLAEAIDRINGVIADYASLAASLDDRRDEATAPTTPGAAAETPEPAPSASSSPSPDPSPSSLESPSSLMPEPSTEPSATASPSP
jgi:hypothetical protein